MKIPKSLYKYESLSPISLENLKAQAIYFGSPLQFNDPYDCAITPNIRSLSDKDVDKIRHAYLSSPSTPAKVRSDFQTSSVDALRQTLMRSGLNAATILMSNFLKSRGVSCFSEKNNDLLMWSHYGGRYKGFCLEFSTSSPPFDKAIKVKYQDSLPELNVASLLHSGLKRDIKDEDQVLELFCTKSLAWAYEAEWRCIHHQVGTRYVYTEECLKGIYFGPDISEESLEIICLILKGQNENVRFWRGRRSTSEFKVLFDEFTYTSYLDAKKGN